MKTTQEFIREMFSENGRGSSKRLVGFISVLVILFCASYLTILEGGTEQVEGLLQTIMISACALLGVSSVTSAFKKTNSNTDQNG